MTDESTNAAAAVGVILNIVLPKDEKTFQKDASI